LDRDNNRGMRDWLIFIRTAEMGSLSKTARQLDLSTAAVSKAITRLELYLGAVLFTRTSLGMKLTEAGTTTLHRAKDITASFNVLLEEIRNPEGNIKGTVRFVAPAIVCEFLAGDWCYEYIQKNPMVRVFLDARERPDLRIDSPELDDIVLRSGRIESDNLIHRKLNPVRLCLCASQAYLDRHPAITHPRDLEKHVLFGMHHHGLAGPLNLFRGDENYVLPPPHIESGLSSNNLLAMMNLVMQGKGISIATPSWLIAQHQSDGQIVKILPDWKIPDLPIWLIWKQRSRQHALHTHFIDYIEKCWNRRPQIA